jgi:hypothetical protein
MKTGINNGMFEVVEKLRKISLSSSIKILTKTIYINKDKLIQFFLPTNTTNRCDNDTNVKNQKTILSFPSIMEFKHLSPKSLTPHSGILSQRYFQPVGGLSAFNDIQHSAFESAMNLNSDKLMLITGPGGTGKTYLLQKIMQQYDICEIRYLTTAPTGISALNVGGVTITSAFKIPPGLVDVNQIKTFTNTYNENNTIKFSINNIKTKINNIQVLIIDEISMLNFKILKIVEFICRVIRNNNKLFGDLKVIMSGDFLQLQPFPTIIYKDGIRYTEMSDFIFDNDSFRNFTSFYLNESFRQTEKELFTFLNNVRIGHLDDIEQIISKCSVTSIIPYLSEYTIISSNNDKVNNINLDQINRINNNKISYIATYQPIIKPNKKYFGKIPNQIVLCKGARVICTKNLQLTKVKQACLPYLQLVNGMKGTVTLVENEGVTVKFDELKDEVLLNKATWIIKDYNGDLICSMTQIPLMYGWAATITQSQGVSYDKLLVDFESIHESGQAYVALSRCKTIEHLKIINFDKNKIITNKKILEFYRLIQPNN